MARVAAARLGFASRLSQKGSPVAFRAMLFMVLTSLVLALSDLPRFASAETEAAAPARFCPDNRPDRMSAGLAARWCGGKVEVLSDLSETTQVWAEPNGTFTADQALGVARFQRDGKWIDVELTLQKNPDGSISPKAHPAALVLSGAAKSGTHVLAALGTGEEKVNLGWVGRLPDPILSGTLATYPSVFPGMDLVVEVTRTGYEQSLIVKNVVGLAYVPLAMLGLKQTGPGAEPDGAGGVLFKDKSGKVIGRTTAPLMWDAAVDANNPGEHLNIKQVDVAVDKAKTSGAHRHITLSVDQTWLTNPGRQFPITIDPGTVVQTTGFDTYVTSGVTTDLSNSTKLALGTQNSGSTRRLAYVNFNASGLEGSKINWATLKLWSQVASTCANGTFQLFGTIEDANVNTRWSNRPILIDKFGNNVGQDGVGDTPFGVSLAPASGGCTGQNLEVDATALFQYAADDGQDWFTAALSPYWDDTNAYYKEFRSRESATLPHVTLNWNEPPSTSALTSSPSALCTTGSDRPYMPSKKPRLSATITDSDGAPSNVTFEWWTTGGSRISGQTISNVPSGSVAGVDVPDGAFSDGGIYSWRVQAGDPSGSPVSAWSEWCEFTVDVTKPGTPVVSSRDDYYPSTSVDNGWGHGGYGQAGIFTFTPGTPSNDLVSFTYKLDTQTAPTTISATAATDVSVTPAEDGVRTLTVTAKDKAGNTSSPATYVFNVGRAGLTEPKPNANIFKTTNLTVQGDSTYTRVRFQFRRGPDGAVSDIPWGNITTDSGQAVSGVPGYPLPLSNFGHHAVWDALSTLGNAGGVAQVRAYLFPTTDSGSGYATQWITINLDPTGVNVASSAVGPGSVNLMNGDYRLTAADASEFGLGAGRFLSTRDSQAGWAAQGERLTNNLQQVSTDLTGFGSDGTATLVRSTSTGHGGSPDSLEITPNLASGDTYATLGGGLGAMNLGMKPGHRYRLTGWIYVPLSTGLVSSSSFADRALRMAVFHRNGSGYFTTSMSSAPSYVDGWQRLSLDYTVPADATEAFIRLYNGFAGGSGKKVYWDNLSVQELVAPFGPQWSAGAGGGPAGTSYTTLEFPSTDLAKVNDSNGDYVTFSKSTLGIFFPQPGAESLALSAVDTTHYRLSDRDGTVVEFTLQNGAQQSGTGKYAVTRTWTRQSDTTMSYAYDVIDNRTLLKRVIAPTESGIGDCSAATPAKGCRVLEYDYSTTTTATPTAFGDVVDRVRSLGFWSWDPAANAGAGAVTFVEVAHYAYDELGQLREVWDPRLDWSDETVHHVKTAYSYDQFGILTTLTPPAQEPWQFAYTTIPADSARGRLASVARSALSAGTATNTVVYGVPLSGANAPFDMSSANVSRWSTQLQLPAFATAIYSASQIPDGNQAAGTSPSSWTKASVVYLDGAGRVVNQLAPGGHLDATWYDEHGHVVQQLTSANRKRALDISSTDDLFTEQQLAAARSTHNFYSPDGRRLVSTFQPAHQVQLENLGGLITMWPVESVYAYDEGSPATGDVYDRLTSETTRGVRVVGDNTWLYYDSRTTRTEYDWTLEMATKRITDPGGLNLSSISGYDSRGRLSTQTTPAGGGLVTTPATRVTVYYSAQAVAGYSQCGNRPEWAGLVCLVKPGGQPASGMQLVTTTFTYDRYQRPESATESTSSGVLRTATSTYDMAGRPDRVQLAAPDLGEPLQTRRYIYDKLSGQQVETQSLNSDDTVAARIIRSYDSLDRLFAYRDADGNTSTITHDLASRPLVVSDGKATRTYTYDESIEPRGFATAVVDSIVGRFTGSYDEDGNLVTEAWPNGVTVTVTLNEIGAATGLRYAQPGCGQADCTLYSETNTVGIQGQVISRGSTFSSQFFGYDKAGRLISTADTVAGQCTTRMHTFDTATNRTGITTYGPTTGGGCQTTTPANATTWTLDTADRITNDGYTYDALGRTLTMPGQDSAMPGQGDIQVGYHANDMARTIAQGNRISVYTLDVVSNRFRSWTDNASGTNLNKVSHYGNDSDSPAWTDEGDGKYTRAIFGLGGVVGNHTPNSGETWMLSNLRGDIIAGMAETGYGLAYTREYHENGQPRNSTDAGSRRYGWLGGAQRASDTPGGLTLMGVRLYAPASGRFLSTDPVYGGNSNAYEYCQGDGVGCTDTTGAISCKAGSPWFKRSSYRTWWGGRGTIITSWGHSWTCHLTHNDVETLLFFAKGGLSGGAGGLAAKMKGVGAGAAIATIAYYAGDGMAFFYDKRCRERGVTFVGVLSYWGNTRVIRTNWWWVFCN